MDATENAGRKVILPLRLLAAVAAILVTIAGTQLFPLAPSTERHFAWTVKPPLSAAFLGAAYWASLFLLLDIVLGATWRQARLGLYAVFTFVTLTLIVTLVHVDRFHFGAGETLPVVAAWAWLLVYILTPIAFGALMIVQSRQPGTDEPGGGPLPSPLRVLFAFQVVILVAVGAALLLAPAWAATWWPWQLTPLVSRAIGAWLLAIAVAGVGVLAANDRTASGGPGQAYFFLGVFQIIAVADYAHDMDWTNRLAWPYVVFWAAVAVTGLWGAIIARR